MELTKQSQFRGQAADLIVASGRWSGESRSHLSRQLYILVSVEVGHFEKATRSETKMYWEIVYGDT